MSSGSFGEQRELTRRGAAFAVGQSDRIVAGEAGVAVLDGFGIAPGLAHGAVETVDRDEGESIDNANARNLVYRPQRSQRPGALRRVATGEAETPETERAAVLSGNMWKE